MRDLDYWRAEYAAGSTYQIPDNYVEDETPLERWRRFDRKIDGSSEAWQQAEGKQLAAIKRREELRRA